MPSVFRKSKKGHPEDQVPAQLGLIPEDDIVHDRRPYASKLLRLSLENRVSTPAGVFSHVLSRDVGSAVVGEDVPVPSGVGCVEDDMDGSDDDIAEELAREARAVKKQKQWRKWSEDVIPALLQPYMTLLRETEGLRDINSKQQVDGCVGCSDGRLLNVTCVYFESRLIFTFVFTFFFFHLLILCLELEKITLCTCKEPALQLLQHGFFPCAPQLPSLAVDLGVLDFAGDLFINAAPNTTAWCETLEGFLSARCFKLSTRVCILL